MTTIITLMTATYLNISAFDELGYDKIEAGIRALSNYQKPLPNEIENLKSGVSDTPIPKKDDSRFLAAVFHFSFDFRSSFSDTPYPYETFCQQLIYAAS